MERLWSLAGAISGNLWQKGLLRKPQNQAKSVAMGCDPLPLNLDGKEGVDGSSPSEGSAKSPLRRHFLSARLAGRPGCGGYGALYGAFRLRTSLGAPHRVRFYGPTDGPSKVELWSDASSGNGPAALVTPRPLAPERGA